MAKVASFLLMLISACWDATNAFQLSPSRNFYLAESISDRSCCRGLHSFQKFLARSCPKITASNCNVCNLRCKQSGGDTSSIQRGSLLGRAYNVAAVSWSAACAARLILPLPWTARESELAVNVLACTIYPLFLFVLNALTKAAAKSLENGGKGKGTLASDTYKRLNLSIFM